MGELFIYQILNHYTSPQALDPGFHVLDNSSNERPDWFEYWPMRKFLLNETLDEQAFYGFFSPKFRAKTNLTAAEVQRSIRAADGAADIFLFTPNIDNSAHFFNVFKHGDAKHPGLMDVAKGVFGRLGLPTDLDALITDSRTEVYSNFFVARPRFWREWLAINEKIFEIAETQGDSLGAELRAPTSYRGEVAVPMKIFIVERIATWILTERPGFAVRAHDAFAARSRLYKIPVAVVCDALKIAYSVQGRGQYKQAFQLISGLRGILNLQIRLAGFLRSTRIRSSLNVLGSYWHGSER